MQLRPEQLAAHLDKPLAPLYLLHGDEPLLVIEAADAIRAAARKQGFEEREVIVVGTSFKWDELFLAAGNMSLFGGNKLVDLRIPSGKPGREGSEALQRYVGTLGPGIVTLITLPELDWQAKKAAWVTALANAGVAIECNAPPPARLPQWIAERLGGLASLTAVFVILTGIFGAIFADGLLRRLGVKDEASIGFALGLASHGIGTARACSPRCLKRPAASVAGPGRWKRTTCKASPSHWTTASTF